jgi:ABC-type branched-subunit amino acid transport system substrate-binding protein
MSKSPYPDFGLAPYKIGCMVDLPGFPGLSDQFVDALRFAFEEAYENHLLERPVEVIERVYPGHPWRGARENIQVARELIEQEGVLGIAGPFTTDNSIAILSTIEELKVPAISICGSQRFLGDFAFQIPNGGMADEPAVMGAWLRANGHKNVVVITELPSQIAEEYCEWFRYTAQFEGISIMNQLAVPTQATQEEVSAAMARAKSAKPDALVYFGLGLLPGKLTAALHELDWFPPRIMCTAFCSATYNKDLVNTCKGWVGVDQYDERNTVLSGMLSRFEKKHGKALTPNSAVSCGYDIGRLFALGLSRMRITAPEALRDGLETIRMMPAATGAPDTVISFGKRDHRGLQGIGHLVLRRGIQDATELVGVAPIR